MIAFETMRPTRMRPETITSWNRGRDQDQLLWDRDWDQKSGLEITLVSRP